MLFWRSDAVLRDRAGVVACLAKDTHNKYGEDLKQHKLNLFRQPKKSDLHSAKVDMVENLPDLSILKKSMSMISRDDRGKVRDEVTKTVVTLSELEAIENTIEDSRTT